MADEGKAIVFYRCNFFYYFVSTDERPAMGSQPNLASRSQVVSIYKCHQNLYGLSPKFNAQQHQIIDYFRDFYTRHRISPERNVASTNQNASVIDNVSPKSLSTFRVL